MKEHTNDSELQRLLREKLEEHTVPAPDFAWPAIEKELFPPAKKRRPFFWWFVFTGLFLGTLTLFFLFQSTDTGISSGMSAIAFPTTLPSLQPSANPTQTPSGQQLLAKEPANSNDNNSSVATTSNNYASEAQGSSKYKRSFQVTDQSVAYTKTHKSNSATNQQSTKQSISQKQLSSNTLHTALSAPAHAWLATHLLVYRSTRSITQLQTIAHKLQPDTSQVLPASDLWPKTIAFQPDPILPIPPLLPPSKHFDGYSFIDVYAGAGRNRRTYSGIVASNSNAFIIDRTIPLKNTNFGIDYNYQFLPFASARIGVNMGSNRYVTRLFPIRIANTDLNNELDISSPSGDLRSAPLELDDQASSISDTTTFLMRIVHRSRYFSVPLSILFNTTNEKGPQLYGCTGFDFVFRGNDQNTLIVRRSQFERSYSTSNPRGARGFYSGWHLGVGLASNNSRRFQFYGEFNYAQVFGNYYSGKVISIRSSNLQLNAGLRINLKN